MPSRIDAVAKAKPIYETMPGFEPLSKAIVAKASREGLAALPGSARDYVDFIEDALEVQIALVGLGAGREQTIDRRTLH